MLSWELGPPRPSSFARQATGPARVHVLQAACDPGDAFSASLVALCLKSGDGFAWCVGAEAGRQSDLDACSQWWQGEMRGRQRRFLVCRCGLQGGEGAGTG